MTVPVVHFDFRLPLPAVKGGELSVQREPNAKAMLKVLGEPSITVSLLTEAS